MCLCRTRALGLEPSVCVTRSSGLHLYDNCWNVTSVYETIENSAKRFYHTAVGDVATTHMRPAMKQLCHYGRCNCDCIRSCRGALHNIQRRYNFQGAHAMAAAVPAPTAVTHCNFTSIHANVRPPKTLHTHGVIPHPPCLRRPDASP